MPFVFRSWVVPFIAAISVPGASSAWAQSTDGAAPSKGPRSREVWSLIVYDGPESTYGTCEPLKVTVTDDDSSMFRVGIYESEVGGTGGMWRAAAWTSTVAAAQITRFHPASRHVAFEVNGRIDGPSAGALMTIGILAAVRNDEVRSDTAMTGMINPDLSIGPVGGIPHKIQGAAKAGKKLVLIPAVSRVDFDKNLKREVDLIEVGKKAGIEVKPVFDLYSAYRVMTGQTLPRLPESEEPTLSEERLARYSSRGKEWLVRAEQWRNQFDNLPEEAKSDTMKTVYQSSLDSSNRSMKLAREGEFVGAYRAAFESGYLAANTSECARMCDIQQRRGLEAAVKECKTATAVWPKIDIAVDRLKRFEPDSLQSAVVYMSCFSNLIEAMSFAIMGDDLLSRQTEDEDAALQNLVSAAVNYQYTLIDLMSMDEMLADAPRSSLQPAPAPDRVKLAANLYRRAADANLTMFETLHVERRARQEGASAEATQIKIMNEDTQYAHLRHGLRVLEVLRRLLGEGPSFDYAMLTAMGDSFLGSSFLIAKYYSLEASLEEGTVVSIGREKMLGALLEFAEEQGRRSIGHLVSRGVDASGPIETYLAAKMKRELQLGDKLDALWYFWASHHQAQIMGLLSDNGEKTF